MQTSFSYLHPTVQSDMRELAALPLAWGALEGKRILVTGANGMLATYLVYFFAFLKEQQGVGIRVTALSRNEAIGRELFGQLAAGAGVELLFQDIAEPLDVDCPFEKIFHFAGNASPYCMETDPVGILAANLLGTKHVLEAARPYGSHVVFASTREVYGEVKDKSLLTESDFGYVDPAAPRSCYPESKRAAEALLAAYAKQYGIPTNAIRLAHVFGPGIKLTNDGRIMADLLLAAAERKPVVLKSKGEMERAFCYLTDALAGILHIALKAPAGEAYNLSNEDEPLSVLATARLVAERACPEHPLPIAFAVPKETGGAYCTYRRVGLDTTKLRALGWQPQVSLGEGIRRTLSVWQ